MKYFLTLCSFGLIFLAACSDDDNSGASLSPDQILASKAMTDDFASMPRNKKSDAIFIDKIRGDYKLKMIAVDRKTTSSENPDWRAVHILAEAGVFSNDSDTTRVAKNFKGMEKDLAENHYLASYLQYNFPLELTANNGLIVVGKRSIYYYNGVKSNSDRLSWLADTGNIDRRNNDGKPYLNIFSQGVYSEGVYTHDFGFSNVEAVGMIFQTDENTVEFHVEYKIIDGVRTDTTQVKFMYVK